MTQAELARRVGAVQSQIGFLERGERRLTVDWMGRIAAALGVAPQDLMNSPALQLGDSEVEPVVLDDRGAVAEALAIKGLHIYRVLKDNVAGAGVRAGDEITVEQTEDAIVRARSGDVLLCTLRTIQLQEARLVLCVYVEGDLFVTHRQTNKIAVRRDDPSVRIDPVGVVIRRR
jgi:transcriptional regulator with XRE-family HTH domain